MNCFGFTGFNNRIVNPGSQPLKGYWTVIDDSWRTNEVWERVSWTDNLPLNGCAVDVSVRAGNDRLALANAAFLTATNDVALANVTGRYIEVRLGLTRTNASQQPVVYDLTLHATCPGN